MWAGDCGVDHPGANDQPTRTAPSQQIALNLVILDKNPAQLGKQRPAPAEEKAAVGPEGGLIEGEDL